MSRGVLHRPRRALMLSVAVLTVVLVGSLASGDRLHVAGFTDPGSQSSKARERLHVALGYDPSPEMVILARSGTGFAEPLARDAVTRLATTVRADPAVGHVDSAFGADAVTALLSQDNRKALVLVNFRSTLHSGGQGRQ